jgi:hypothetical protein
LQNINLQTTMSNWQEICKEQLARLEQASVLADRLSALCNRVPTEVPEEARRKLDEERPRLERQLERLRANRFEVAVIGLEKAGKSALLNAWLGTEILPSADERCTYTTTELWSAPTEEAQELRIEYRAVIEIEAMLAQQKAVANPDQNLQNDIAETKRWMAQILKYAGLPETVRSFRELTEITEELKQAVFENRPQARAIRRIQLKTTALRSDRDIVFHDVPGFDSPVEMHRKQAERKLSECDAIIFAKLMANPTLTGPVLNLLRLADAEDPHVKVADKVFVVLTRADSVSTKDEFHNLWEKNKLEWPGVPSERILPVCATARLAQLGTGSPETNAKGRVGLQRLDELGVNNGIEALRDSVDHYIDHERIGVLKRRCDALMTGIGDCARRIIDELEPRYARMAEEGDIEDQSTREFNRWWGSEWASIEEDFLNWYGREIEGRSDPDAPPIEHKKLTELRKSYAGKVTELLGNLKTTERMKDIYGAENIHTVVPADGNKAIRDQLYTELDTLLCDQLPAALTQFLRDIIDQMMDKGQKSLFGISDIRQEWLDHHEKQSWARINHGFETLFLRFGRVALKAFIPVRLEERGRLVGDMAADLKTLEVFYDGKGRASNKSNLTDYLRLGLWVATQVGMVPPSVKTAVDAATGKPPDSSIGGLLNTPPGKPKPVNRGDWNPFRESDEGPRRPRNFEEVVKEIKCDLEALEDYLQNSVFNAAGFVTFSEQELLRLRNRFLDLESKERRWHAIVQREVRRQNSNVPFTTANQLQDFRARREIAVELSQVRELYGKLGCV